MNPPLAVLIVEDNPDDFLILRELLESSEEATFRIHHEVRIESAKTTAKQNPIEVAIIDLSLPDSFGLDTFRTFHDAFPSIPVVIMTGYKDHALALKAVQEGAQDYLYKGESSSTAIIRTLRHAIERQRLTTQLKEALEQVKRLKGLLPICSACKNIRDDQGYWKRIEAYISEHSEAEFSHSICPDCARKLYPDLGIYE